MEELALGKVIVVTGTPGTGKTLLARKLAEKLNGIHIDLSELVLKEGLYTEYDVEVASFIIDEEAVIGRIKELASRYEIVVIDSHYGEIVPPDLVWKVIVLRTDPEELEKRLQKRGWWWEKIRENVEAEILSVCSQQALNVFGRDKVYEIDTTNKNPQQVLEEALEILQGKGEPGLKYDWLATKPIKKLSKYLA